MKLDNAELDKRYTYHAPRVPEVAEAHDNVRKLFRDVGSILNESLPDCRESALVQTKLEEAMFWANAAIARNK